MKVHTGNKNYTCDICQQKFYDSSVLKKHIVVHTDLEQNHCYICQKRFFQTRDLKKHITVQHECNVCNKLFVKPGHKFCRMNKTSVIEMPVLNKSEHLDSLDTEMFENVTVHSKPLDVSDKEQMLCIDQVRANHITQLHNSNHLADIESKTVLESVSESREIKDSSTDHSEVNEVMPKCCSLYDDELTSLPKVRSNMSKTYNVTILCSHQRENTCQIAETTHNETFNTKQYENSKERVPNNLVQQPVDKNQAIKPKSISTSQLEHKTINTKPKQTKMHRRVNAKSDKHQYEAALKILGKNQAIRPKKAIQVNEVNCVASNRLNLGQIDTTSNYSSNNKNGESRTDTVTNSENLFDNESDIYLNTREQVTVSGRVGSEGKMERYVEMATANNSDTLKLKDTCESRAKVKADKKQDKPTVRTCRHCQRNFYGREEYLQHLRGHMKVTEFTCADCGHIFNKWRNFSKHTCSMGEPNEKSVKKYEYVCAHCDCVFKYEGSMNSHMNKRKVCHICKKVCCTITKMKQHMLTHREFYECDQCKKKFYMADILERHNKKYHSGQSYKCNINKRSFLWKSVLKRHSQSHQNDGSYKCEKCNRHFILPCSLSRHKAICGRDTAAHTLEEDAEESLKHEYHHNEDLENKSSHIGVHVSTVDKDEFNAVESFAKKTEADNATCVPKSSASDCSTNSLEKFTTGTDKRSVCMRNSKTNNFCYQAKLRNNTNKRKTRQQIDKITAFSRNKLRHTKRILNTQFRSHRNNTEKAHNNVNEIVGKGTDDLNEQYLEESNDMGDETIRKIKRCSIKCAAPEHAKKLIISNKLFHKDESRNKLKVRQNCNRLKKQRCSNDTAGEITGNKCDTTINQRTKEKCGQVKGCLKINQELRNGSSLNVVCKEEIQLKVDINEIIKIDRELVCDSGEETTHFAEATKSSILHTLSKHAKPENVNKIMIEGTSKYETDCFEDVCSYVEEIVVSKDPHKAASSVVNDRSSIMEWEYGEEIVLRTQMNKCMPRTVKERRNGNNDLEDVSIVKEISQSKEMTERYSTLVGGNKRKYELELCRSDSDIVGVSKPNSEANTVVEGIINKLEETDSDLSSDSTSDEDSDGYEECTSAEVKAMLSKL